MQTRWSAEEAEEYVARYGESHGEDVALRTYTTRLLGGDPALVLHGGGNTSVKTLKPDELGRQVSVICVKGSGWDMGGIEPEGLPAVTLEPLRDLEALDGMSDEAMVNALRRNLLLASAPTPSVETLLHAFLPHKFVDHTHADAVLALADQPDAERLCRDVFGPRVGIVPYIMPGFGLAKACAETYADNPDVDGLVLINHGVFSFGEDARTSYEHMIDIVSRAERAVEAKPRVFVAYRDSHSRKVAKHHADALVALRGLLSTNQAGIGNQVLECRNSTQIEGFLLREDLDQVATRGTATPDHVIRTKRLPLILRGADGEDFTTHAQGAIEGYVAEYRKYFRHQSETKRVSKTMVHPLPIVFLLPGLGLVTAGKTPGDARIAADIYEHTIDVIQYAEQAGTYTPLTVDHLFDMEYWSLEQAKLGKKKPPPLAGHVILITGAAGGIGQATARVFAGQGANLVLTDLDEGELELIANKIQKEFGIGVVAYASDLTREADISELINHACHAFGGLDCVISNAGMATSEPVTEATQALKRSLDINLLSHQYLAKAAVHVMRDQGMGGCLLFNASKSAFNPGPGFGAYSIAKAGLVALMKQYAVEHAAQGIRASAVNADRVRTNLFDAKLINSRAAARGLEPDQYFRANLLGAEVMAEDVGKAFLHLYKAKKTTAAVLTVDGGNIAASPR